MPQSNSELLLQKTSVHYVLADKYAANQQRGQLHIAMLAGDFFFLTSATHEHIIKHFQNHHHCLQFFFC